MRTGIRVGRLDALADQLALGVLLRSAHRRLVGTVLFPDAGTAIDQQGGADLDDDALAKLLADTVALTKEIGARAQGVGDPEWRLQ